MSIFLVSKDLPEKYSGFLSRYGSVIHLPRSELFSSPVSGHPDILLGRIGNTLFVNEKEYRLIQILEENHLGFETSGDLCTPVYPFDCHYNFFQFGSRLFACEKSLSEKARGYCLTNNIELVNLKQGYAKCSTIVTNNGIITADSDIAGKASSCRIDCCHVEAGHIRLDPFSYGFIGGASCCFDSKLVFFGNIHQHPSFSGIISFCKARGIDIYDFEEEITDFGGAIYI